MRKKNYRSRKDNNKNEWKINEMDKIFIVDYFSACTMTRACSWCSMACGEKKSAKI